MLIKALCEYADFLDASGEDRLPEGWGSYEISHMIMITPDGELSNILDIREDVVEKNKKGKEKIIKKKVKRYLPERHNKTTSFSEIIEHRGKYIFGLQFDNKILIEKDKKGEPYSKFHDVFVKRNLEYFEDIDSVIVNAYKMFITKWNPENEKNNPLLLDLKADLNTGSFCFALSGHPEICLEEDELFKEKYAKYVTAEKSQKETDESKDMMQCSITGEMSLTARIHDKIEFPGGRGTGCFLVSMNEKAYESYGKTQSYNSGISEVAMKRYTSTLNKLLADKRHRIILGKLVLVFFAMKNDDTPECDEFAWLLGKTAEQQAASAESGIKDVLKISIGGTVGDAKSVIKKSCDENVTFYIAGLTVQNQNDPRICQRFIYRSKFGEIVSNLKMHQADMCICDNSRPVYFSGIEKQLISPKSTDTAVSPPLMTSIVMAALNGGKYPVGLLDTVIRRVRTDSDEEGKNYIKFNDTRVGIIKACLNRKYGREEITMALNEENRDPAYLCGRLFAVLEKIQQEAAGTELNRTITDAYFSSAAGRPSAIMPKLIQLSANHRRKLSEGRSIYFEKLTGEIISRLESEFPKTLDLDGQGRFIVGYYQQKKALFTPKTNNGKEG